MHGSFFRTLLHTHPFFSSEQGTMQPCIVYCYLCPKPRVRIVFSRRHHSSVQIFFFNAKDSDCCSFKGSWKIVLEKTVACEIMCSDWS